MPSWRRRSKSIKRFLLTGKLLLGVIRKEILLISEKYGDERRTRIGYDEFDISMEDLIPRENVVITVHKYGIYQADEHGYLQKPEPRRKRNQGHADP